MIGRKVPWTHSRAIVAMVFNSYFKKQRSKKKKQARKEERRFLKFELKKLEIG